MAVIGAIRKRAGLVIGLVGLSLLLFVLGDILTSNSSFLFGSDNNIGEIDGKSISYQEFERKIEQYKEDYKLSSGQENFDDNMLNMFREQVWGQLVNENVLGKEYEDLGLDVSDEELMDMLQGKNIHQEVRRAFSNPQTGEFNPADVTNFLKSLDTKPDDVKIRWGKFEQILNDQRIAEKYNNLIKKGLYVTSFQAKLDHLYKNKSAKVNYILASYSTISDSSIQVSDDELEDYYNEHRSEYKQEEHTRKIEYVTFEVLPSDDDKKAIEEEMNKIAEEFKASDNDSLFVMRNAETSKFDTSYVKKGALSAYLDSILFNAPEDTVVGPYYEADFIKVAKLTGFITYPDSVRARHILLKLNPGDDTLKVKATADSILQVIKGNRSKFPELVKKFSQDPGSIEKGGVYDWFQEGRMVKPFNDACFLGKKGDLTVVQTEFGFHIIEVLEQSSAQKRIQVAVVDRKMEASSNTYRAEFTRANQFAGQNNTEELFNKSVAEMNLPKRVKDDLRENDRFIPGLDSPRELVRWAFAAKKGDVSKVFELGNKYVIAYLVEIREKGNAPLDQVRERVLADARRDKKAKQLTEKINGQLQGVKSIEELAQKLNEAVQTMEFVTFSNSLPGVGSEPEVSGAIFAMKPKMLSKPVKGNLGVYILWVDSFTEPPQQTDFSASKTQLMQDLQSRADYEVFNALKEIAGVKDNRARFY
jgi:peptidyl-prolyl cis-trans isomerase D